VRLRRLESSDVDHLAEIPGKDPALFARYLAEQAAGDRVVVVVEVDGGAAPPHPRLPAGRAGDRGGRQGGVAR
jgi:hypothetical protein